ncbi:MAG: choice-of-anchor Q domain-containing protein [Verrucomicrobiota bacterium]
MLRRGFYLLALLALPAVPSAFAATLYVDAAATNATPPFSDWSTAAGNIQDAVDAAAAGDLVLVNDGVYGTGTRVIYGSLTNRVAIDKAITVQSLNGPAAAIIQGEGDVRAWSFSVRCVYLTNGAMLSGFTLTNGVAPTAAGMITNSSGGGAWCETLGVVSNCVIAGNEAYFNGGGVFGGTAVNCVITNNYAWCNLGGGACLSTLLNCLVQENYSEFGGGVGQCVLSNCIVGSNNWSSTYGDVYLSSLRNCQVLPDSYSALTYSTASDCTISAGTNSIRYAGAQNSVLTNCTISGFHGSGAQSSTLVSCTVSNNTSGYGGGAYSCILIGCTLSNNRATNNFMPGGGGAYHSTLTNCIVVWNSAIYTGGGVYNCVLAGCSVSNNIALHGGGGGAGGDFSALPGTVPTNSVLIETVLSGNQSCLSGGGVASSRLVSCILSGNICTNGAGGGAASSVLSNCTLTANIGVGGGGSSGGTLTSCKLTGNWVTNAQGGGASGGTLINCIILGNQALGTSGSGGGLASATAFNCTVLSNYAGRSAGGAYAGSLSNCIVYYNSAGTMDNYQTNTGSLNFCCTTPLPFPARGSGNFTNEPLLVDGSSGNFHLQSGSPCINSGNNRFVTASTDFDGNPRIQGGTVDVGVFEFQNPSSILSYAWAQQYGIPTDGSADQSDGDQDGASNWQEWKAGTSPVDALSVLRLTTLTNAVAGGLSVTWQSVGGVTYFLQRTANPASWSNLKSNLVGQAGTTTYTDATATNGDSFFYRIAVQ